jgi:hypothetical protein
VATAAGAVAATAVVATDNQEPAAIAEMGGPQAASR